MITPALAGANAAPGPLRGCLPDTQGRALARAPRLALAETASRE